METKLLGNLGKIAGIGGIAIGVLLLVFRQILEEKFLTQTVLSVEQTFAIVIALMTFTFGIAAIGIIAWLASRRARPAEPVPPSTLRMLAVLVIVVLGSTIYIATGAKARDDDSNRIATNLVGKYQVILGPGGGCNGGKPNTYPDKPAKIKSDGSSLTAYNECDDPSPVKVVDDQIIYMYGQKDKLEIKGASVTITETRDNGNAWQKIQ